MFRVISHEEREHIVDRKPVSLYSLLQLTCLHKIKHETLVGVGK
jgi:tyrosine-protein phosphatase YwqE